MKPLFICRQNTGRSQIAMELLKMHFDMPADSAGTIVEDAGNTVAERLVAENVIIAMKEDYGIDISNNVRKQVTPEMAEEFDSLIVMAEPDTIPALLLADPRTVIWSIKDGKGQDLVATHQSIKDIDEKVRALKF